MSYFSFENKHNVNKCAVIGCSGVGATIAQALSQSSALDALVLVDSDKRIADCLAADLCCALDPDASLDIWSGDYSDVANCFLTVLALGHTHVYESAHADLTELNLPIIRKAIADITAYNSESIILVVSEPCEIMTYTVLRYAGLPQNKIIGIGTLPQTLYLRRLLGKYFCVDASQIDAVILGQSGDRGIFCMDNTHIAGMSLEKYLSMFGRNFEKSVIQSIFDDALHTFERAEYAKGRAEYAVARACKLIADCVLNDSNTILPLCIATDKLGEMATSCMSIPCLLGRHGARALPELFIAPAEYELLRRSSARLHTQILDTEQLLSRKYE